MELKKVKRYGNSNIIRTMYAVGQDVYILSKDEYLGLVKEMNIWGL
jgi:hypothetical protein